MRFYDKYLRLCVEKDSNPTREAKEMGFTSSTVNRWKNGSTPTDATLLVIAKHFGVTMADLLPDEEIVRRELSQYPPDGRELVAEEMREKHPEYFGQKKYPADFSEVDTALFDEARARRNDPRLRIMFHKMEKATDEQIDKINAMIDIFMGESQ